MKERPLEKRAEWRAENKYNSFNSDKGLTYHTSHYLPTLKWLNGQGQLPPPIELSLDPAHACNYKCPHCNAKRYLEINPDEVPADKRIMTRGHLENIIDFAAEWGVRGVCLGGGGEPLANRNVWTMPSYINKKGMESSYASNGSLINDQIANEMMYCRWVGISVDSGDKETFEKIHKVDMFDKVISNLELLTKTKEKTKSNVDISYKFLISPANYHSIYDACKLAKKVGVQDFHVRPADLQRRDIKYAEELNYNMPQIMEDFKKCHEIEDENFRVFTIMHKYDTDFKVEHKFKNCISSSLMLQACSDGNAYVCADHRLEDRFKLGAHYPNPRNILSFWGSTKHRDILRSINVDKECTRCTYGVYAIQMESISQKDNMCLNFP